MFLLHPFQHCFGRIRDCCLKTIMISFRTSYLVVYEHIFLLIAATSFSYLVCRSSNGEVYLDASMFLTLFYKHGGYPLVYVMLWSMFHCNCSCIFSVLLSLELPLCCSASGLDTFQSV